jgi:DHA1 family bicyclomycin/chloramphenicol resistance-like MFS transporter
MSSPSTHTVGRTGQKEFIALMAVLMSVVAISIDAMLPALGIIGQDLNVSHPNQAQYIIGFIFAGMAIGQLISGPLSDALGRKKILFGGLAFFLIGSVVCVLAPDIETMLAGRFIQGLGVSGPYISVTSIVRDRYSGRAMARIMSLVMTIFIMVPAMAPAIGQTIVYFASWQYIFVMYIVYAITVGAWVFLRLEETLLPKNRIPYKASNIWSGVKTVLSNRVTLSYTIALGLVFGALTGLLNTIQQVFHVLYDVGDMFAVYFGLQALAFGVSSFVNSKLVDHLGMRYLCLLATAMIVVISVIFFVVTSVIGAPFLVYFFYVMGLLFSPRLLVSTFLNNAVAAACASPSKFCKKSSVSGIAAGLPPFAANA